MVCQNFRQFAPFSGESIPFFGCFYHIPPGHFHFPAFPPPAAGFFPEFPGLFPEKPGTFREDRRIVPVRLSNPEFAESKGILTKTSCRSRCSPGGSGLCCAKCHFPPEIFIFIPSIRIFIHSRQKREGRTPPASRPSGNASYSAAIFVWFTGLKLPSKPTIRPPSSA